MKHHQSLTTNLIVFCIVPLLLNLFSFIPFFCCGFLCKKSEKNEEESGSKSRKINFRRNPSLQPLILLLFVDILMSIQLIYPIHNFLYEDGSFTDTSCNIYGALDMILSLSEILLACVIAFDRYIVTCAPKWGKWRCHSNYFKLITFGFLAVLIWSFVPILGYGKYSTFHNNQFCSIDWRQGNIDTNSEESRISAHRYIAFLTATCLVFFLIPVCIASSLYYSIIDHVDRQNSMDMLRDGPDAGNKEDTCTWAVKGHVAKIGLGCLLVSVVPFFGYSVVCLNPMRSDFKSISFIVVPVILSRISTMFNPIFYIWLNPEIVPINELIAKCAPKPKPPRQLYHTINLIADVPGMSFPILTPTIPRRQLPKIPPHLLSPSHPSLCDFNNDFDDPKEFTPML
ncbi:unnamed protein product [Caenorhabditis angaria]|uniref:G-protein coupled receptors family 1 profile domain-containing protein n=1 Tax=Caenorhabditis angaria TaxID=860376 RepID=A0A9P1ICM1_9PELO|nr:unnamed protein product [Caenorhabditis angaria]